MVTNCMISGCPNRYGKKQNQEKRSFFRFPSIILHQGEKTQKLSELRRSKWFEVIVGNFDKANDSATTKELRVCSDHFVGGKPSGLYEINSPDWLPSVHVPDLRFGKPSPSKGHGKKAVKAQVPSGPLHQYPKIDVQRSLQELNLGVFLQGGKQLPHLKPIYSNRALKSDSGQRLEQFKILSKESVKEEPFSNVCTGTVSQTDLLASQIKALEDELCLRNKEVYDLRSKVDKLTLNQMYFEGDNSKTNFYTGIPTYEGFLELLEFVKDQLRVQKMSLTPFQQLMLTCMRIHLNVPQRDLAYRFCISQATASRIFAQCLEVLNQKLLMSNTDMNETDNFESQNDSDSAPEEENFQNAKDCALREQEVLVQKAKEKKQMLKEKRKEIQQRNTAQKEEKQAKISQLGSKKLPAAFLEKISQFVARKDQAVQSKKNTGEKRKADEVFDDVKEDEYNDFSDFNYNQQDDYMSIHGSTRFEVMPIQQMGNSMVGNSALEFRMRKTTGSNVQRETVQDMLSNKKKQAINLEYAKANKN